MKGKDLKNKGNEGSRELFRVDEAKSMCSPSMVYICERRGEEKKYDTKQFER